MKTYTIKYVLLLGLLLFPIFFCQAANEKVGVSLDKTIYSFNILPGQKQEFVLNVKNITEKEQRISLEIQDFSVENENKTSFLAERNEMYGMKDWIKYDEDAWTLKPEEEKRMKFTIEVPEEASVGSHYSAVSFKALPMVDINNFQKPIVGGQLGCYIFVNVLGNVSGQGEIEEFSAPKLVDKEANFQVKFKNKGNIHYIPHGGIEIKNLINQKDFKEKAEKHFVFPSKSFTFEYDWQEPSAFGVYRAKAYFIDQEGRNLEEEKILFGKYFLIITSLIFIGIILLLLHFKRRRIKSKKIITSGNAKNNSKKNSIENSKKKSNPEIN